MLSHNTHFIQQSPGNCVTKIEFIEGVGVLNMGQGILEISLWICIEVLGFIKFN